MSVSLKLSKALSTLIALMFLVTGTAHAAWEQPPFLISEGVVTSDQNGNATIVSAFPFADPFALRYSSATDTLDFFDIAGSTPSNGRIFLSGDQSGSALLVWIEANNTDLHSSFFNGTGWTVGSPVPFGATDTDAVSVNMNGPTTALATWELGGDILSATFSAGTWSTPITATTGFGSVSDYSANGTAAVIFNNGGLFAINFIGGVWSTPVLLNPTNASDLNIGMDANGRAIAAWNSGGTGLASTFNGTTWGEPVVLSTNVQDLELKVAPGGTAVAIWQDSFGAGYSSSYNGTTWGQPVQYGAILTNSKLALDDSGNALVIYATNRVVFSRRLPLGATLWGPQEFIGDDGGNVFENIHVEGVSLSNNGFGFALWEFGLEPLLDFLSVEREFLPPAPPPSIVIKTCKNQFAAQTDRVNFITWTPSPTFGVVAYNVRRNGVLVALIPLGAPLEFVDHNRCNKNDVYSVTAVLANGVESVPITVSLE